MMNIPNLSVLIVEDDDFQRNIVNAMLMSLGITSIHSAGNGKQALDILLASDAKLVDVVLCDLNMPEMDGMEFLRHLGEMQRDVAVILVSGMDDKVLTSVGKMAQMYGIQLLGMIEKPILLEQLRKPLLKHGKATRKAQLPAAARDFALEEILQAISSGQLEPFFQPKVDMKTGRLVGAEALARWRHPEHGVIGPNIFIPQLELSGNIDELTFHILKRSASALRALHDKGHLLTVSVNLSLVSLVDTTLADKITQAVREAGVEPQFIVLEITESAAMTDVGCALENLARLCMHGFTLSIDDYGTGSSSLQQLTRIAFGELKIDQSFITDFAENKALRIVVESSIDMAHKLQVKSVAEGVESQQDWEALKSVGCDTVQGYFIAKPMDEHAFSEFADRFKEKFAHLTASVPEAVRKTAGMKVLVIEDDDFTRKLTLQVLRDLGYSNVVDADNAMTAIELLKAHAFDLVITDVNMPGVNGLQLIQKIRAGRTDAKPETRIVVLTSFSQTEILGSALALDINGFLVKPIVPAVVEEKLAQALSERLHLHSPFAYEAVRTELKSLPPLEEKHRSHRAEAASAVRVRLAHNALEQSGGRPISLNRLRPGMLLKESVRLKDGTLILSPGHALSELTINRLHDLKAMLPVNGIVVEETF
jgi:EAL domain-containing protein (putative c-di-GMP-specific phosphodiesterase class I)/DNA-binding NarL/FixJ family response regulator